MNNYNKPRALLFTLVGVIFSWGCSPSEPSRRPPESLKPLKEETVRRKAEIPVPPWQLWRSDAFGSADLEAGERFLSDGKLAEAENAFRRAAEKSEISQVRQLGLLRLTGTQLKQGKSQQALAEISKYVKANNLQTQQLDPRFSIIAAYSYWHQKQLDQTLAWFGVVFNATSGQGVYAHRATTEARRIARSLPPGQFESYARKWSADSFAGPIFSEERLRRAQGGAPIPGIDERWFTASYYQPRYLDFEKPSELSPPPVASEQKSVERELISSGGPYTIGVLLPLSGQYAQHAKQVKDGIELAVKEYDSSGRIKVQYADTEGDAFTAASQFDLLVGTQQAVAVLGPLLVKTTEAAAQRSGSLGIPLISFTKKEGIPALGRTVFRLGATVESQVRELLAYAVEDQGLRSFAVIYPQTNSGMEFASAFREIAQSLGVQVVCEESYYQGDDEAMKRAVKTASRQKAQAVFIPDSLESAFPVLEQLKVSDLKESMLLGPALWNDPIAIRGYGQLIEGAVYVAPYNPKSSHPAVLSFRTKYTEQFLREPSLLAAQGYDAATFLLRALDNPAVASGNPVVKLDSAQPLQGATGALNLGSDGEIRRRMSVLRLEKGEAQEVMVGGVSSGVFPPRAQPADLQTEVLGQPSAPH